MVAELVTFLLPFAILAVLAIALDLQFGQAGLFNAGVAGFYAIGAYTAAILLTPPAPASGVYPGHIGGFNLPAVFGAVLNSPFLGNFAAFLVAAAAGAFLAAVGGLLIGLPTLRLRADYLAIATLALAEIFRLILTNARSLTAGTIGIVSIPRPFDGLSLDGQENDATLALLFVLILLAVFFALYWMARSPWGRVLRAIREDEEAAMVLGKDTYRFKLQAFTIGCAVMGLAGAFVAVLNRVIFPSFFVPLETFFVYVAVILGGAGNTRGVLVGAGAFFLINWASIRIKDYVPSELSEDIAFYRLIAIGILLIVLVLFRPQGILPERKYIPRKEAT